MAKFLLGNVVKLQITATGEDGVSKIALPVISGTAIPDITLRVRTPDGTVRVLPSEGISNPEIGIYEYEYLPPATGIYRILWVTNGDVPGAVEDSFTVEPTTLI